MTKDLKDKIPTSSSLEKEKQKLEEREKEKWESYVNSGELEKDYTQEVQLKLEDRKTFNPSKEYLLVNFKGKTPYYNYQIEVLYRIKKVLMEKGYKVFLTAKENYNHEEEPYLSLFLFICWGSLKDSENSSYRPQLVSDAILDDFLSLLGKGELPPKYAFKLSDYDISSETSVIPALNVMSYLGFYWVPNKMTKRNFIGFKKVVDKEYCILYNKK